MLIVFSLFSTGQNTKATLDQETGEIRAPFEKAQLWANIIVERDSLKARVAILEQKLDQASRSLDSLEQINFEIISDQLDYLRADRERDAQISAVSEEELGIWRSLSRGLRLDLSVESQVYTLDRERALREPVSLRAELGLSGTRFGFGVVPDLTLYQMPSGSQLFAGGVKLRLSYRMF